MLLLSFGQDTAVGIIDVPLGNPSYEFIERMETKGIIKGVRDGTRPLSRIKVAELLMQIEDSQNRYKLTEVEVRQLEWLKREFRYELEALGASVVQEEDPHHGRWHLFAGGEGVGNQLWLDPVVRFSWDTRGGKTVYRRSWGGKIYGYLDDTIGFYLYTRDTSEWGKGIRHVGEKWREAWEKELKDPLRGGFSEKGIGHIGYYGDRIDHDEVDAAISIALPWFKLEFGKGSNVWGPGYHGQIALSDWAPSYGQVKLSASYGSLLDFTYIHAWLHSGLVDTLRSYQTPEGFRRTLYRRRYLAGHRLEFTPLRGLDIGLSETVIYGDRGPEVLYLIPVMFFWSAQHYLGDPDNLQMSGDIDVNLIDGLRFYVSLFVDEIYISKIFSRRGHHNWIGVQGGVHLVPLTGYLKDLDLRLEYTRINPFVYSHKFPINNFESYGYILGHQIGSNADEIYARVNYRHKRPLLLSLYYNKVRKGELVSAEEAYNNPSQRFLSGEVEVLRTYGFGVTYEPMPNLFLNARYKLFSSSGGSENGLSLSFRYNF